MALAAVACLVFGGPAIGRAAAAPAQKGAGHARAHGHAPAHASADASAPPLAVDRTPLPQQVIDAGAGTKTTTTSDPAGASSSGSIVRMIAGLAIVLAVIYAVYWLLKTYGKSKRGGDPTDSRLTVLGTTTLAPNRLLHLVRVGDEVLLVGSAEQGVTRLRVYDADALRRLGIDVDDADPSAAVRPASTGSGGLIEALRRVTAR